MCSLPTRWLCVAIILSAPLQSVAQNFEIPQSLFRNALPVLEDSSRIKVGALHEMQNFQSDGQAYYGAVRVRPFRIGSPLGGLEVGLIGSTHQTRATPAYDLVVDYEYNASTGETEISYFYDSVNVYDMSVDAQQLFFPVSNTWSMPGKNVEWHVGVMPGIQYSTQAGREQEILFSATTGLQWGWFKLDYIIPGNRTEMKRLSNDGYEANPDVDAEVYSNSSFNFTRRKPIALNEEQATRYTASRESSHILRMAGTFKTKNKKVAFEPYLLADSNANFVNFGMLAASNSLRSGFYVYQPFNETGSTALGFLLGADILKQWSLDLTAFYNHSSLQAGDYRTNLSLAWTL